MVEDYLETFHIDFNKQTIMEMREIAEGIENQIISQYKYILWMYRNIARYKPTPRVNTIQNKLDREIRYFAEHILQQIDD